MSFSYEPFSGHGSACPTPALRGLSWRHPVGLALQLVARLVLVLGLGIVGMAHAQGTVQRADPATLTAIIADLPSGGTVLLNPGDYGEIQIRGKWPRDAPLVLRSAEPDNPARFRTLGVVFAHNVILENMIFDYRYSAEDRRFTRPFQISRSSGVAIRDSVFDGDLAPAGAEVAEGYATGFGLSIRDAERVEISGNEIRRFGRGMVITQVRDLVLRGNELHALRMDGLNVAEVHRAVIEDNHFHDFARNVSGKDHADMIQFWTNGTKSPSRDVTIRRNLLNSGQGWYTHSIFMRNDMVDRGLAGDEMLYRNIRITDNLIINAHLHGITVGEADGLLVRNNTVVRNAGSEGTQKNPPLWVPQIRIAENSRNVAVTRNVTSKISGYTGQPGWWIADNLFVQDRGRMEPGFYGTAFGLQATVAPQDPTSFRPLPGGPLDGTDIGVSWIKTDDPRFKASR